MMNNIQISANFKLREFQCTCNDTHVKLDSRLLNLLQQLRTTLNRPITINSGYRCPMRNAQVKGSPTSQHLHGKAVDIRVNGMTPAQVAAAAERIGFDGIGTYNTFTHLDTRGTKARWTL